MRKHIINKISRINSPVGVFAWSILRSWDNFKGVSLIEKTKRLNVIRLQGDYPEDVIKSFEKEYLKFKA